MTTRSIVIPGIGKVRLTDAMHRALIVVGAHDRHAKVSNVTDKRAGLIYWQAATSLEKAGLIQSCGHVESGGPELFDVTTVGRCVYNALQAAQ